MTTGQHNRVLRSAIVASVVLLLAGWEPFRAADPDVEAGNRAYTEGRYDDALAAYDRADRRGGVDPDGLAFNRGTARLKKAESTKDTAEKQRLVERALEDLKQAGHARDARIRGNASYNRGNLLMGQDKLDDAIEAYKQALREQPDLDDARQNLELAMRRRHKQQQQQKGQQGQQGQQGGQQGQGQQGQGQGQQGQQGQGQQGQGQQGQGQQGQGQNDGSNQPQNGQSGQNGQNGQNGGSNQPQNGQGSNQPQNGQGSNQPQNGQGSNQPQNGQGSNQPQNGASGQGNNQPPRGRTQRGRGPQSPRTPIEGKLDDLDTYSRRLQRDATRRRATGRSSDPQHDW